MLLFPADFEYIHRFIASMTKRDIQRN